MSETFKGATSIGNPYDESLHAFLVGLLRDNADNVECVVLYGGLVRDGKPIPQWSDIDLIVLFNDIRARNPALLASLLDRNRSTFHIRIDLTQLDSKWLTDPLLVVNCFNSEVLNSLAMRQGVSRILYGALPPITFPPEHEMMAARFYIDHTLAALRRFLIENVFSHNGPNDLKSSFARVTRWVFSIIRASLRLFEVYVHPYAPSLRQVATLFPELDLSIPYILLGMREDPATIQTDYSLFSSIGDFIEMYTLFVLRKAAMTGSPQGELATNDLS